MLQHTIEMYLLFKARRPYNGISRWHDIEAAFSNNLVEIVAMALWHFQLIEIMALPSLEVASCCIIMP